MEIFHRFYCHGGQSWELLSLGFTYFAYGFGMYSGQGVCNILSVSAVCKVVHIHQKQVGVLSSWGRVGS